MLIGMGTPVLTLPMSAASLREVDLLGVFRYAHTYAQVIDLLNNPPAGMPDVSCLVTQRYKGLDRIEEAFKMAGKTKDESGDLVIKVVVDTSSNGDSPHL